MYFDPVGTSSGDNLIYTSASATPCTTYQATTVMSKFYILLSISIHPCRENQLDALLIFILSLFRQSTATCFGHICSPSSGGILYI